MKVGGQCKDLDHEGCQPGVGREREPIGSGIQETGIPANQ